MLIGLGVCLLLLVVLLAAFWTYCLEKDVERLTVENKQQAEALRKYEAWHRTWQLASPTEAAKLKPPLIRHKSYIKADYSKDWRYYGDIEKQADIENYTDGIVYPQQYLDRELEWNKEKIK